MAKTSYNIYKKYYFVSNAIIYEISTSNDKDNCGVCPSHDENGNIKEDSALAGIFPYITLTYTVSGESGSKTKYVWLQNYIEEGDSYDGQKFVCIHPLHGDESASFIARHVNEYKNACISWIKNGYSKDELRKLCPKYFNAVPYDDIIGGKSVTVTGVTGLGNDDKFLSDANIGKLYEQAAKEEATRVANNILKIDGKQVDTLTLNTKDLEA